jgi:PAS domain S-box-containing protein
MQASLPSLFDRYPDAVVLCGRDRLVQYANPAMGRAAGTDAAAALGVDLLSWLRDGVGVSAPSLASFAAALDDITSGTSESFERDLEALGPSRERLRYIARGGATEVAGEKGILVQLHDVTAHWQGERAKESRFHLLQTIIDAIPSPIFFKDRAGVYRGCNKAFERYIGMPQESVVGSTVWDVAPKDLADKYHAMDEALMRERGVQVYEHGVRYADGSIHEVVFHKATFANESGEVDGLVGVMLDITERKGAEEETRKAVATMEAAVKLKGRFLAVVSHEIRTPLNGLLGMLELLERSGLGAEQERMLVVARTSAEHLLYLLNNVLDFSKLEAEKVELEANDFAIHDLVFSVTEANAQAAQAKGIDVAHAVGPGVPAVVRGDGARLRQVLFNLVSNALKFTDRGSVRVTVTREDASAGPLVLRFEVRDTGRGINPGLRERLFTEFAQADESIARRFGGTGLGLAISKRLVERMGGQIDFESEPGKGALFWFSLPLASALDPKRPQPLRTITPAPGLGASVGGLRALVVEDNHVNQLVAAGMLHALGHTARIVPNGAEAIEAVEKERFDLVLMDLEMPEMDGLAATRAIRAAPNGARVPVLAVTAHVLGGIADECRAAGMDGWISKPLRIDPLACAIAACFTPVEASPSSRLPVVPGAPPPPPSVPAVESPSSGVIGLGALDGAQLESLAKMMGRAELDQLLDEFLAALTERLDRLAEALEAGDARAAFPHAHALKGMSEQVGATALAAHSRRWESALREGDPKELSLDDLRAAANATRIAITHARS